MKSPLFRLALAALLVLPSCISAPLRADLNQELAFTAFSGTVIDTSALADGQVMQARGTLLDFQRGITAQALYVLAADPATVAHKLITWDPASHPELKVWTHHPLPLKPTLADFTSLGNVPDNSSTGYLIDATADLNPDSPALQLDKAEAAQITAMKAQTPDKKALFAQFWGQVLNGRIANFLSGQIATAKYSVSDGDIPVQGDLISLLRSDAKVYRDIHPLLANSPVYASTKLAPVALYFDCFDVEGYGSLGTGAVFQAANGPAIQSADVEYYCNSGIYATIELEKIWPITINGKAESLVWREDLVSTANVAYLHGMERLASSMLMLQDVKQGVDAFRAEFK